jgi:hypothetical protein
MCRSDPVRAQECHNVVKNNNEFGSKNRLAEAQSNLVQKIFYLVPTFLFGLVLVVW